MEQEPYEFRNAQRGSLAILLVAGIKG